MKCFYCGSALEFTGDTEEDSTYKSDALGCRADDCEMYWSETRINREGVPADDKVIEKSLFVRVWNELRRMCEANYRVPQWLQQEYEDGGAF